MNNPIKITKLTTSDNCLDKTINSTPLSNSFFPSICNTTQAESYHQITKHNVSSSETKFNTQPIILKQNTINNAYFLESNFFNSTEHISNINEFNNFESILRERQMNDVKHGLQKKFELEL